MGFAYLAGWRRANEMQQTVFANNLLPTDRAALLVEPKTGEGQAGELLNGRTILPTA